MNLILFDSSESMNGRIELRDQRAMHIQNVLKLDVGDDVRVGSINGKMGLARVLEMAPQFSVTLEVQVLDTEPPKKSPVELILGLPRPKSLKRLLRASANLGIKSIHLINTARVDKSYWSAPALKPEALRMTLLEGLSIAKDTVLPTVHLHKLFKPFAQDVAPILIRDAAFVAHPTSHPTRFKDGIQYSGQPVLLAIGPEGGFTEYEVRLLNEAKFQNFSLGPRVLSVESAIPVLETHLGLCLNPPA